MMIFEVSLDYLKQKCKRLFSNQTPFPVEEIKERQEKISSLRRLTPFFLLFLEVVIEKMKDFGHGS